MKKLEELWTPVLINNGIFKDDYLVSNMGRVKYKRKYVKGWYQFVLMHIIQDKRPYVKMKGNGRIYSKSVAKLVLSSFNYRTGCECAHITYLDGDMTNCELSNLRYTADLGLYERIKAEKPKKGKATPSPAKKRTPVKQKDIIDPEVQKSCEFCKNNPCFEGIENLSTDFGMTCRGYKPRPIEEINEILKQ